MYKGCRIFVNKTVFISTEHSHPGGVQVLGDFIAVGTGPTVQFYDVGNPGTLGGIDLIGRIEPVIGYLPDRSPKSGSSTSLAKLQNGRYLLMVSSSDACPVHFYVSDEPEALVGTTPTIQFSNFGYYAKSVTAGTGGKEIWDCGETRDQENQEWDTYQNMSLVTDCQSGDLYVVATANRDSTAGCPFEDYPCIPNGIDYADLYSVDVVGDAYTLTRIASTPFNATHKFDAAAGLYVDPAGRMYIYATEYGHTDMIVHFNEYGPDINVSHTPEGGDQ